MDLAVSLRTVARALDAAAREGDGERPAEVASRLLAPVAKAFDADGAALMLMDPQTLLFTTGAVDRLPAPCCHPFFESELDETRTRTFRRLAREGGLATALSRACPPDASFLHAVVQPAGYADELRAVCRDGGVAWGALSLWRASRSAPFSRADERLLDAVAPTVGAALRDAVLRTLAVPGDADRTSAPGRAQAVMVFEGRDVVEASPEARELLREIDDPGRVDYRPLDHLLAIAQREPRFSTVVGTGDGRWITAHGTALSPTRTAVVLTSASPVDLFGTLVTSAGLTEREVEVTRLLCRGSSDAEIAEALTISPHTAHDHVRSVRRKLGVRNRAEVASRVFADHYLDRFLATAAVTHAD